MATSPISTSSFGCPHQATTCKQVYLKDPDSTANCQNHYGTSCIARIGDTLAVAAVDQVQAREPLQHFIKDQATCHGCFVQSSQSYPFMANAAGSSIPWQLWQSKRITAIEAIQSCQRKEPRYLWLVDSVQRYSITVLGSTLRQLVPSPQEVLTCKCCNRYVGGCAATSSTT